MAHHLVELALWLLLAFILGALLGCLFRRAFSVEGANRNKDRKITGLASSEGYAGEGMMAARTAVAQEKAAQRVAAEEARRQAEKEAADRKAVEEAARKKAEEEAARRKAEEEAARKRAEEEAARRKAEEEAARKKAEEEAARKAAEEEAARKRAEEEAARRRAEEEAAAKKATEEQQATEAQGLMGESGAGDDAKSKVPPYGLKEPVAGEPDNLQMISGIGPKLEKLLHDLGIYYFAQIARWDEKTIAEIDDKLKFKGRIQRDEWVRQAKLLAEGKLEEFERDYGTGGLKDASGQTRSGARTRRKK